MTLREYVQSLAQRLNKIEGTSGVSKDYVDAADDIIRGSVTALSRRVDIEDEAIRGSIATLGEVIDDIIDGTQPVASAMEADSALKAINTASGLNIDDALNSKASLPNTSSILHTFAVGTWIATEDGHAFINVVAYNGGEIRVLINSTINYARFRNNGNAGIFQSISFPFRKGDRIEIITTDPSVAYLDTNAPSYALGI